MCRRCWACSPPQRDRPVGMGMECWAQEPRFPTGLGCRTCNKILLPVVLAQPSHRAWDTRQLGIPLFPLGGQGMSPETGAVGGTLPAPVRGMEQLPYPSVHPSVHPPAPPLPPPHPSLGAVPSGGAHPPRVCVPRGGRGTHTPVREGAAPPRDRAHPRVRVRGGGGGEGRAAPYRAGARGGRSARRPAALRVFPAAFCVRGGVRGEGARPSPPPPPLPGPRPPPAAISQRRPRPRPLHIMEDQRREEQRAPTRPVPRGWGHACVPPAPPAPRPPPRYVRVVFEKARYFRPGSRPRVMSLFRPQPGGSHTGAVLPVLLTPVPTPHPPTPV